MTQLPSNEVASKKEMAQAKLPWRKVAGVAIGLVLLAFLLAFVLPGGSAASQLPSFGITSVTANTSVTIQTANFPANQEFQVTMGAIGTQGVGGTVVGTTHSGAGGSFTATYNIPAALQGVDRIAIRLQSAQGYFAYNWFYNSSSGGNVATPVPVTPGPVQSGIPTFSVESVVADSSVTIRANNFPANQTFQVTMGAIGTQGVGGTSIGTQASGAGGSFTATYNIPANLHGMDRIAIRLQSTQGYFAYNWFHNSTAGGPTAVPPTAVPGSTPPAPTATPGSGSTGFPSFTITAVQKDATVTIQGSNFPPNQTFQVTMGAFGTQGVGGMPAGTQATGAGGSFTATYNIPASLIGSARIAIRLQSAQGYYAYNWFHNVSAP
jgi:hypothetical protein